MMAEEKKVEISQRVVISAKFIAALVWIEIWVIGGYAAIEVYKVETHWLMLTGWVLGSIASVVSTVAERTMKGEEE